MKNLKNFLKIKKKIKFNLLIRLDEIRKNI